MVERLLWEQEVASSNLVVPTYRTEDGTRFRLEINLSGLERAFGSFSALEFAKTQVDTADHLPEYLPAAGGFRFANFFP